MREPLPDLPSPWLEQLNIGPESYGAAWPVQPHGVGPFKLYHHHHPELELNLVASGTGRYLVGERRYLMVPGTLLWLFPGQIHCLYQRSPTYRMHMAVWQPDAVKRLAPDPVLASADPPGHFARLLPLPTSLLLAQLIGEVAKSATQITRNYGLAFLLGRAWEQFAAAAAPAEGAALHPAVAQAVRLINEDPAFDSTALARRIGVQTDYLRRCFHRDLGISLVAFRQRQRLQRIVRDWHPQANITRLALASGFGSYAQFHRVFTAEYGMSPRAWIKRRQLSSGR